MRLDKFLVDCGVGSRTEVKQLLKQKKIAVNGKKETDCSSIDIACIDWRDRLQT